jgi:hypothetical protein
MDLSIEENATPHRGGGQFPKIGAAAHALNACEIRGLRPRIFREDWVADFAFIDGKGRRECGFAATTAFEDLLMILSSMVRVHAIRLDGCGLQGRVKIYVKSCATDQQVGAAIGTATVAI